MTIFLLIFTTLISIYCGWANYFRAQKYKKQRDEYKRKLKIVENLDTNEMAIMLIRPYGVFEPTRQN